MLFDPSNKMKSTTPLPNHQEISTDNNCHVIIFSSLLLLLEEIKFTQFTLNLH